MDQPKETKNYPKHKLTSSAKNIANSGSAEGNSTQNVAALKSGAKAKEKAPREQTTQLKSQVLMKQQHGNDNSCGHSHRAANVHPIDQTPPGAERRDDEDEGYVADAGHAIKRVEQQSPKKHDTELTQEHNKLHHHDSGFDSIGTGATELETSKEHSAEKVKKLDREVDKRANKGAAESSVNDSGNGAEDENLPIPLDLHRDLKRVLRAAEVKCYIIKHDPDHICKISIDGCHVTRLQNKLQDELKKSPQYTKFSITTKDMDLDVAENDLPTLDLWTKQYSNLRCMFACQPDQQLSIIELMLKGNDSRRLDAVDIFGATTAHSLLTRQECMQMMRRGIEIAEWLKMIQEFEQKKPYMRVPDHSNIDITSHPFPVYRHWFLESEEEYSFLADLVVFKLKETELKKDEWLSKGSGLSSQYGRVIAGEDDMNGEHFLCVDTIGIVRLNEDLSKLIHRRIACAGKTGKVVPTPSVEQNGWVIGLHLCFVLDKRQTLVNGDCGAVVYLLGKDEHDEDKMIGMFIGTYVLDPRLHQAVVLLPILKQLEANEKFYIQDLLPLYSLTRPGPQSGYRSGENTSVSLASQ